MCNYELEQTLKTSGMRSFVEYIEYFEKGLHVQEILNKLSKEFDNYGTCTTKFNAIKRIYEMGDTKKALLNIVNSDSLLVSEETKVNAIKHLVDNGYVKIDKNTPFKIMSEYEPFYKMISECKEVFEPKDYQRMVYLISHYEVPNSLIASWN